MKSTLVRFWIRNFKPTLRKASEKLDGLQTAEGTSLPENTHAELRRDMARLCVVREQIQEIEQERLGKLQALPSAEKGSPAMMLSIARGIGLGVDTTDMLVTAALPQIEDGDCSRLSHFLAGTG